MDAVLILARTGEIKGNHLKREKMKEKAKSAKKAGVMALFYPNAHLQTNLVLILRKTYKGVHSAQVGFPGGKFEDDDKDRSLVALFFGENEPVENFEGELP